MATRVEKNQSSSAAAVNRGNDVIALFILAVAVLVFLSLATYSATDWNFFNNSSQYTKHNWIGIVGSSVANLLLQIVGLTAYFTPVLLALVAWRIYKTKSLFPSISRTLAFILFIVSISGLIYIFGGYAGMAGKFIAENLGWLLGKIGSGILLGAILLASALVITNLSFAFLSESLNMALDNFKIHFDEWQDKRREAKKHIEPKAEKLPVVKSEKKPTISAGETIAVGKKEKPEKAKSEVSEMLKEFAGAPENKPAEIENNEEFSFEETPETEKHIVPTISSAVEKPFEKAEPKDDPFAGLNDEIAPIGITPIRETGELAPDLIEAEPVVEPIPVKAQEPQNFDDYILPTSEFLTAPPPHLEQKEEELLETAQQLTEKTKEFKVDGRVMHICQGPVVTTYEFKPDPGVKYSRVTGLADDLCLALKAESIRIERIPGKAFVGIEVPNLKRETIYRRFDFV